MIIKGGYMKKKLLVLLIAVIPALMPNLASAIAIDVEDFNWTPYIAPPPCWDCHGGAYN